MRKFHFASICNVLPCELRLFWYSTGALNRHLANKLPTCCQQSADKRQKIFVRGGKRQWADNWPTVGQQLANCWPTVGQLSADCWPTVFWGSCSPIFFVQQCYVKWFWAISPLGAPVTFELFAFSRHSYKIISTKLYSLRAHVHSLRAHIKLHEKIFLQPSFIRRQLK